MIALDGFEELAAASSPGLLRLAVMLTGDPHEAQDLLQATLVLAHRQRGRNAEAAAPRAYVRRIMTNEYASQGRRLRRRWGGERASDVAVPDPAVRITEQDSMWRLLTALPRKQRAVLVLRCYEDLSDGEIADLLGCGPVTVRSHAARALDALRRARLPRQMGRPARDVVGDGELEQSLRRAFRAHEHLADPHAAERVAEHVSREVRAMGSRRSRRTPLVALAVAGVLATAGAQVLHQRGDIEVAHGGPANLVATRHRVTELIALAPVLPGARARTHSPVAGLDKPPSVPVSDNVVDQARWWTAPGTVEAAVAWLKAHPPRGLSYFGGGSSSGPGQLPEQDLTFSDRASHTAYSEDQLVVSVVPFADGVALRADAQAIWLPDRPSASQVPLPVDSVEVRVTRPGTRPRTATVTGDRAQALARAVNDLPAATPGRYSCPAAVIGTTTDVLTFRPRDVVVTVDLTGCTSVTVSLDGRTLQPGLAGAHEIDGKVQAVLD